MLATETGSAYTGPKSTATGEDGEDVEHAEAEHGRDESSAKIDAVTIATAAALASRAARWRGKPRLGSAVFTSSASVRA